MSPNLGDFGVVRTEGWAAALIRWGTRSDFNHAFVYVGGGLIVEAEPSGAQLAPVTNYPIVLWSDLALSDDQRSNIADAARRLVGTPYSWVDVVCVGLADVFGWSVPEPVRKRLRRREELMCSQLVDTAYLHAGVHLFDDGRIPGDVAPHDLATVILEGKTPVTDA